jgi:NADH:ubiquinone oxidoreductase subunit C
VYPILLFHALLNTEVTAKGTKFCFYATSTFVKFNSTVQIKMCTDIISIDYPRYRTRFAVIYSFLSLLFNTRFNLVLQTGEHDTQVSAVMPSLKTRFKNAIWSEREIWDMFGIIFANNNDLRRLLTDYGFKGHPLRKDYPLSGFYECNYNDWFHQIVEQPIQLVQSLRQNAKSILMY